MTKFVMPKDDPVKWNMLPAFTQGYIEAMFFTECNEDRPELEDMGFSDIHPNSLAKIISNCDKFFEENEQLLKEAVEATPDRDMTAAGHDFWFTRNGHGVGFWETSRWKVNGDKLDAACKKYGEAYVEAGDDGKLHYG